MIDSNEEVPAFIFQYNDKEGNNIVDMITTISPNYRVYESKEEEKLILLFSFSDRFIFAAMNESSFANKYLVGRA